MAEYISNLKKDFLKKIKIGRPLITMTKIYIWPSDHVLGKQQTGTGSKHLQHA